MLRLASLRHLPGDSAGTPVAAFLGEGEEPAGHTCRRPLSFYWWLLTVDCLLVAGGCWLVADGCWLLAPCHCSRLQAQGRNWDLKPACCMWAPNTQHAKRWHSGWSLVRGAQRRRAAQVKRLSCASGSQWQCQWLRRLCAGRGAGAIFHFFCSPPFNNTD